MRLHGTRHYNKGLIIPLHLSKDVSCQLDLTKARNIPRRKWLALEKPAQYLGGEKNAVYKDAAEVDVRIALGFPDTYEVGMSHVGMQILYQIANDDPGTWAERAYMPLPDMETLLKEKNERLRSIESQTPLGDFDVLGFSLQYELCGTNILAMLELSGLSLYAADRDDSDPIVIGGGPYTYHPEALAPFFDVFSSVMQRSFFLNSLPSLEIQRICSLFALQSA